ncbi:MAG: hypothetical protein M1358_19025, partial [Chloroflexi bacterium]|nr:hypothetical protein [Chloroflexota bacterium]
QVTFALPFSQPMTFIGALLRGSQFQQRSPSTGIERLSTFPSPQSAFTHGFGFWPEVLHCYRTRGKLCSKDGEVGPAM